MSKPVPAIDFERLYREFDLKPGADLADLKLAFRRRAALLHPDRLEARDPISQHLATEHLQGLTRLYNAALQFHRQHGRLPGALPQRPGPAPTPAPVPEFVPTATAPVRRSRHVGWILLLVAALGFVLIRGLSESVPREAPKRSMPSVQASNAQAPEVDGLQVGMPESVVMELMGAPIAIDGDRWLYGPSWLRFERGELREWYDSPLHRLRISRNPGRWQAPSGQPRH